MKGGGERTPHLPLYTGFLPGHPGRRAGRESRWSCYSSNRYNSQSSHQHEARREACPKSHERWPASSTLYPTQGRRDRAGRGGDWVGRLSRKSRSTQNTHTHPRKKKKQQQQHTHTHLGARLVLEGDHLPAKLGPPLRHAEGVGRVREDGRAAHRRVLPGRLARQDARDQACPSRKR